MGGNAKWRSRVVWTHNADGRKVPLRDANGKIVKIGVRKQVGRDTIEKTGGRRRAIQRMREALEFRHALQKAKESQDPSKAWRVDAHKASDYLWDKTKVTEGGSTIAVTSDGDIISVCKNKGDTVKGKELIAEAVAMGGVKLDSYDGNHKFYTKNGFEPVSWCKWDGEYAPPGWTEGRDNPENVIFYRYVGHPVDISLDDFYSRVPASNDYDAAQRARDNSLNS